MRRAVPVDRLVRPLEEDHGLGALEVTARRDRYGANDIVEVAYHAWRDLLRDTVKDPMIWFLAGTAALYAFLGERAEAVTLLVALVPLVGMDAFLHRRTQASTEGLSSRLASVATAVRDGRAVVVPASALVPGDLAIVTAGQAFPADGILAGGSEMQADESALTGEAYPVRKEALRGFPAGPAEPIVDGVHWGFAGTRLLTGAARLRIVFTGTETLYGEIVRSARGGAHARTPLQGAVARLVSVLLVAATVLCVLLALIRYAQGHGLVDAALSAVTLGVAALPEEFPVAFTFFLGVGVFRLARRQALVRRAVSVENIGRITSICSDKTGTITEGRLRVSDTVAAEGVTPARVLELAAMASRRETGDPLDAAILDEALAHGIGPQSETVATFPFTEDRRRETAIVRGTDVPLLAATKGSPEVVLAVADLDAADRARWAERVGRLALGGHKVIACAWRELEEQGWAGGEPSRGYGFAGLLVCEDAVREGVAEAVRQCQDAGIHTVMVTGDHPATAAAVARDIGLGDGEPRIILGEDLDAALRGGRDPRDLDVVARAIPAQKLDLVRALQSRGEIVAVTGDGVNDVPALQAADVGVAMGGRGTRSAREVASIVLLDDNFRSIVRAIAEGRQLFRNLQLSYQYLIVVHICLVLTATLIPLAGFPLLYLPIHIVWLETLIHPTAMLVFQELPSGDRLGRTTRSRDPRFFSRAEWGLILGAGLLLTVVVVLGYTRSLAGGRVEHARAMAVATLTLASAALAATLSRLRTRTSRLVSASTIALSLMVIQTPSVAALVHVEPLHLDDWALAAAGAAAAVSILGMPRLRRGRRAPERGSRRALAAAGSATLLVALCVAAPAPAAPPSPDVERLLARLDDLYRSKSSVARIEIEIVRPRGTRTLRLQAWTRGEDEALVVIEGPPREAGTATLRVRDNLWNYLPRIARTIRVPPSMMLGSWMGTDFTNDDLVKESSLRKDFVARVDRRSEVPPGWWLDLEARPGVVGRWARIEVLVSDDDLPVEERHFDRKGRLARTMRFDEVRVLGGRRLPSHIVLVPAEPETGSTAMRYLEARFDVPLADDTFSLSRLEEAR